eukprot:TRINITY_DN1478_c5_g1_i1.p1 TRINITY_DN1478_c5_g1~~TRINITY_DN1478_c5_g1_i1.p1  ORF type:complete len:581 (+),score=199.00 TRINITY_DN1478_c5_g1_i1:94-1836(+)
MFAKSDVQTKGETQLRGKETKALRAGFVSQFPALADEKAQQRLFGGAKAGMVLRKLAQGGGFTRAHLIACDGTVIAIDREGTQAKLVPALEAVWREPLMVPTLVVPPPVSRALWRGSDLFLPGICAVDHGVSPRAGDVVAVRVLGNPCCVAVGEMLCDVDAATAAAGGYAGGSGTAMRTVTSYGDRLWIFCGRKKPNAGFAEGEVAALPGFADPVVAARHADPAPAAEGPDGSDSGEEEEEEEAAAAADDGASREEMDDLIRKCFLQVARTRLKKDRDLPVTIGELYARHLRPCRPPGTSVNVSESSYGKFQNFVSDIAERGWARVDWRTGGEPKLVGIAWGHPDIRSHEPWAETVEGQQQQTGSGVPAVQVRTVYRCQVPATHFCCPGSPDQDFELHELHGALTEWVQEQSLLQDGGKKIVNRQVRMCPEIAALLPGAAPAEMPLKGVLSALEAKLQRWSVISGGRLLKPKRFRGDPPAVSLRCEKRRGHNITVVGGTEAYGINPAELADDLKKLLACTATAEEVANQKGEVLRMELVIQGHRNESVGKRLIDAWGLPREAIGGVSGKMKEKKRDVLKK